MSFILLCNSLELTAIVMTKIGYSQITLKRT